MLVHQPKSALIILVTTAAVLACTVQVASARGVLGLFAADESAPQVPAATPTQPANIERLAPVAFVSGIARVAEPGLYLYDFLEPGRSIDLGRSGEITLTFFSPCREETITGGSVTLSQSGAEIGLDSERTTRAASCRPLDQLPINEEPTVRLADDGPFSQSDWAETTVTGRPVFRWPEMQPGDVAVLAVKDAESGDQSVVWSTETPYPFAAYPATAPPLQVGRPYLATVEISGRELLLAAFSIDLDLPFTRIALNALIRFADPVEEAGE